MYLRIAEEQRRGEVARAQHFLPVAHRMVLSRMLHALERERAGVLPEQMARVNPTHTHARTPHTHTHAHTHTNARTPHMHHTHARAHTRTHTHARAGVNPPEQMSEVCVLEKEALARGERALHHFERERDWHGAGKPSQPLRVLALSVQNINRSHTHTHTHTPTENNTPDTDTHTHMTRTTPQTPKQTPPTNTLQRSKVARRLCTRSGE